MTDLREVFANNVRVARLFRKLTQKKLGDRMGAHRVDITFIEAARSDIRLSTMCRVADALRFSVAQLLSEDFEPTMAHKNMLAQRVQSAKEFRLKQIKAQRKRPN
jgi:transcriptional regulator with XRE-family HTH domain